MHANFLTVISNRQKETQRNIYEMMANGLGYKKIKRALAVQEISISLGTLSYWHNTKTGRLLKNEFTAKPSKELAYFIGIIFGDGCAAIDKKNYDYCLQLRAIDKDFVERFSKCVSKLLTREKSYPVHKHKVGVFAVQARCKELYDFTKEIKEYFEKAKPFIEAYPAEFIQGLADSEGCPSINTSGKFNVNIIVASTASLKLAQYTQDLLIRFFEIKSVSRLTHKAGKSDSHINGRTITRTKNLYCISIQSLEDSIRYFEKINFSIKRKHQKLKDALTIINNFSPKERCIEWRKDYFRGRKQWERK